LEKQLAAEQFVDIAGEGLAARSRVLASHSCAHLTELEARNGLTRWHVEDQVPLATLRWGVLIAVAVMDDFLPHDVLLVGPHNLDLFAELIDEALEGVED